MRFGLALDEHRHDDARRDRTVGGRLPVVDAVGRIHRVGPRRSGGEGLVLLLPRAEGLGVLGRPLAELEGERAAVADLLK